MYQITCPICKAIREVKHRPKNLVEPFVSRCSSCVSNGRKKTLEQILFEAREIHGNYYDYSKSEYINVDTKIIVTCPKHGEFCITPYHHINQKQGCYKCGIEKRVMPNKKTTERFLAQCKEKWGETYNYEGTIYVDKYTKIKYICFKHGLQEQYPSNHLKHGCSYCNGRGITKHSKESFINIANIVHDFKYDYSKIEFNKITDYITIICPKHGEFIQRANNHIHLGNGCNKCHERILISKPQQEIRDFISSFYNGIIEDNAVVLGKKEIDIYVPDIKFGLEYHGLIYHTETAVGKKRHLEKYLLAKEREIRLFQIYENEWRDKKEILKSRIKNMFGLSEKIYARKTQVVSISKSDACEFLTKNHLQGYSEGSWFYGLIYNGEIVSCMSFGHSRYNKNFDYELLRFCNKLNFSVVGGASKLFNAFRNDHNGSVVTYADRRYSDGNLYKQMGFVLDGESKPSFSVYNLRNGELRDRRHYQKYKLKDMLGYNDNLSVYEIMQRNKYDRVWDAGQYRFKFTI